MQSFWYQRYGSLSPNLLEGQVTYDFLGVCTYRRVIGPRSLVTIAQSGDLCGKSNIAAYKVQL